MPIRVQTHKVNAVEVHLHGLQDDGYPLVDPLLMQRMQRRAIVSAAQTPCRNVGGVLTP